MDHSHALECLAEGVVGRELHGHGVVEDDVGGFEAGEVARE